MGEGNIIAWRPDGSGDATTWKDVQKIIDANSIQMMVDVTPPPGALVYEIPPANTNYSLKFGGFTSRLSAPLVVIDVLDGAVLRDLSIVNGSVGLRFHPTTDDALVFTTPANAPGVIALQRNGSLQNMGSVPVMTSLPNGGGPGLVVASFENGNIFDGASPLIGIAANATAIFEVISAFNTGSTVPSSLFAGPASATVLLIHDGTLIFPFTPQPAFLGTIVNSPLGCSPSGGPSSMRPVGLSGMSTGVSYFDTTIAPPRPIWWDGTQWVDATGTPS